MFKVGDFVQYFVYGVNEHGIEIKDDIEIYYGRIKEIKTDVKVIGEDEVHTLIYIQVLYTSDGKDISKHNLISVIQPEDIRDGKEAIKQHIKELNMELVNFYKIEEILQ